MTVSAPDAVSFVTPDCPHCATVRRGLEAYSNKPELQRLLP